MAGFDHLDAELRPPYRLWLIGASIHVVLAGALIHALARGLQPWLALLLALVFVVLHGVRQHAEIARGSRRLRVQGEGLWLDDQGDRCWRLRRVHLATRWLMLASLVDDEGRQHLLRVGGDQLGERDARRLLRWLRAGVPPRRSGVSGDARPRRASRAPRSRPLA